MAERLGFSHLILCYPLSDPLLKNRAKEVAMLATAKITTEFAILVPNQESIAKAQRYTKSVVAKGQQEYYDDKRVQYVLDFENGGRPDFLHHRHSGLNQVFIHAGIRTSKCFLVNMHNLLFGAQHRAVILGRIQQNNDFFKKYAPNVLTISGATEPLEMRAPRDLQNILFL